MFVFRLFWGQGPVYVLVDGAIPRTLPTPQTLECEVAWPVLLEKAMAKLAGDYLAYSRLTAEGLALMLTGSLAYPTRIYSMRSADCFWDAARTEDVFLSVAAHIEEPGFRLRRGSLYPVLQHVEKNNQKLVVLGLSKAD